MEEQIKDIETYFSLKEFFRTEVVKKYGRFCWNFLDPRLLETLLFIRKRKNEPMYINYQGMQQRGFRDNKSPMVKGKTGLYVSPHCTGKGIDFNFKSETATETRLWLTAIAHELPYAIRLERNIKGEPISWVHLDLYTNGQNEKITFFDI